MPMYVLKAVNDRDEIRYYAYDYGTGYPYWTRAFYQAKMSSYEDLIEVMTEMRLMENSMGKYNVHCGSGACNDYPDGKIKLSLCRVDLPEEATAEIKFDLKRLS